MYILALLLLFPYGLDGLSCIANGKDEGYVHNYGTEAFKKKLNISAQKSVNNTDIGRCRVIIQLKPVEQAFTIIYLGNNVSSESLDTLNLRTEFEFAESSLNMSVIQNTLSYVCSSGDFCDLQYIENELSELFNVKFSQLANLLNNVFERKNSGYDESITCYPDQMEVCSTQLCHAAFFRHKTTTRCASISEMPQLQELLVLFETIRAGGVLQFIDSPEMLEVFQNPEYLSLLITSPELSELLPSSVLLELPKLIKFFQSPELIKLFQSPEELKRLHPWAMMKITIVVLDTVVSNINPSDKIKGNYFGRTGYLLNSTISYFCTFDMCNSPSISTVINDIVEKNYNITGIINSFSNGTEIIVESVESTTDIILTTSTITGRSNRSNSMSILGLIILITVQCFFVDY
jgi:hypothetical protein